MMSEKRKMTERIYRVEVGAHFASKLEPVHNPHDGTSVIGFRQKDGTILKPWIVWEKDIKGKGKVYEDIRSEVELEKAGIIGMDYTGGEIEDEGPA